MDRKPILCEVRLTLAQPLHPEHQQAPTCNLKKPIFPSTTLTPCAQAPTCLFSSTHLKEALVPYPCTTLLPLIASSNIEFYLYKSLGFFVSLPQLLYLLSNHALNSCTYDDLHIPSFLSFYTACVPTYFHTF